MEDPLYNIIEYNNYYRKNLIIVIMWSKPLLVARGVYSKICFHFLQAAVLLSNKNFLLSAFCISNFYKRLLHIIMQVHFQIFQKFASIYTQNSVQILGDPYIWRLCALVFESPWLLWRTVCHCIILMQMHANLTSQ